VTGPRRLNLCVERNRCAVDRQQVLARSVFVGALNLFPVVF
jgi:hypothetical protein